MDEWTGIVAAEIAGLGECLAVVTFLFVGAVVGSFLNVVAYRVPRGESVAFGRSHCPACGAGVRARDNVPVLGWLLLGGRCRDCRVAIAPRYPLIEAACALVVGATASVELLSGGANLPRALPGLVESGRRGIDVLLFHHDWRLFGMCLLHCVLLVTLLAWSVMAQDGHEVPRRWYRCAIALAVVAAVLWPTLLPVGAMQPLRTTGGPRVGQEAVAVTLLGLTAGWLVGKGLGIPMVRDGLCAVGVTLGWQAVGQTTLLLLTVMAAAGGIAAARGGRPVGGNGRVWAAALVVAAVVQVLLWRWIDLGTVAVCRWGTAT